MEKDINAKNFNTHSDPNDIKGIVTDKTVTLYNLARKYLKEVKRTTYSKLLLQIGFEFGDCTVMDCTKAVMRLRDDKDIIIEGCIYPAQGPEVYNVVIRYEEPKKNPRDDSLPAYVECIRYLRSKFPNMIIDLEPEIASSTSATANKLAITSKKCPVCGELMYVDTGVVLTSNPPQHKFICKICKHTETSRYENDVTFGFGTTVSFGSYADAERVFGLAKSTCEHLSSTVSDLADELKEKSTTSGIIDAESKRTGKHPADVAIDLIKKM